MLKAVERLEAGERASALAIEPNLGQMIVYRWRDRFRASCRRTRVVFDAELRALTGHVAVEARGMIATGRMPVPVLMPGCRNCSLRDACQPRRSQRATLGALARGADGELTQCGSC